jgi:regulator of protease activity HflC (stomatin/prohibitin superfamily)
VTHEAEALKISNERSASTMSGYPMLIVALVAVAADVLGIVRLANGHVDVLSFVLLIAGILVFILAISGFYMLQPNQAAVITLFGAYRGSDRSTGLRWVWPWMMRPKISIRIHNFTSDRIKVNDLRGNPIEIAANVVWRVRDTAQAMFDVADYNDFIEVQIESAIRTIGSRYPYDDIEHKEVTLRSDAEVVNADLESELQERVAGAGIAIDECRIMHLAYAQEIAQAMLRRQQAEAVIAARAKLVQGAVSMVETALQQLSEREVDALDDARRAAMVSNRRDDLCADREAQPVVNAGTLYQ